MQKDNSNILKNTIINDLGDSIKLLKNLMLFNNEHISIFDINVTGDLMFLVILSGKVYSSPH